MSWQKAIALDELTSGPSIFRTQFRDTSIDRVHKKQIALFQENGVIYAIDNRCPHEGYPLAEGTVDGDCVLTCNWHNWKFRLQDGECILGGDHVTAYPTKIEAGFVWIELSASDLQAIERKIVAGLNVAFQERDFGRICREITRLEFNGCDPLNAVRESIRWASESLEYGTTHSMPATADWIKLAGRYEDNWEKKLVCLSEAVDHFAWDSLRHPAYPFSANTLEFDTHSFLQAIESEDHATAEGMISQSLNSGLHWRELEEVFTKVALRHYNDFGHSLIYVHKVAPLLACLGDDLEQAILLPLTRSLCYSTREDLIPEFKAYAPTLDQLCEPLLKPASSNEPLSSPFPANLEKSFEWIKESMPVYSVNEIYDVLLEACAKNWLYYELEYQSSYENPVSDNVGWLDFTHAITFANAVRTQCEKFPKLWKQGLLQMACFLGRNRKYIDCDLNVEAFQVTDRDSFFTTVHEQLLDHGLRDPIFSAHLLKTTIAIEEELTIASESCGETMLSALNRFLNSPLKQKHTRRLARQAIALVSRDFA